MNFSKGKLYEKKNIGHTNALITIHSTWIKYVYIEMVQYLIHLKCLQISCKINDMPITEIVSKSYVQKKHCFDMK